MTAIRIEMEGLPHVIDVWTRAAQTLRPRIRQTLSRQLNSAVAFARERYLSGGTTADRLAVRSGRLQRAFTAEVQEEGDTITGTLGYVYDEPIYARTHAYGATIRARRARYLTIPFPGVTGRARSHLHTFVARSRRGNLIIFQRTAGGIRPLYLLRTQVTIPARPVLQPVVQRYRPLIVQAIGRHVTAALGG
jgi:hypothetical protein